MNNKEWACKSDINQIKESMIVNLIQIIIIIILFKRCYKLNVSIPMISIINLNLL